MSTTPPTRVPDLARRWRLDVDTATYPASSYAQVLGISDIKPNFTPRTVSDEATEDDGADREAVTGGAWELQIKLKVSLNTAGTSRDTVHAFLWTQHLAHRTGNAAAEFGVRFYDRHGISGEAYEGRAFIKTWTADGGLNSDEVTITLKGQGQLADITNPASSQLPAVTSLDPTGGGTAGGELVEIFGHHFTGATDVDFGADAADFTVVGDGHIVAIAPAHAGGSVQVKVTTPEGVSANTAADDYLYA